jgi:hypothetical protein
MTLGSYIALNSSLRAYALLVGQRRRHKGSHGMVGIENHPDGLQRSVTSLNASLTTHVHTRLEYL